MIRRRIFGRSVRGIAGGDATAPSVHLASNVRRPQPPVLQATTAMLVAACLGCAASFGAEPFESFAELRRHQARASFEATAAYVAEHPEAEDAGEAYRFLFETALAHDLAREARPHAERFLKERPDASRSDVSLARQVAMLALALDGQAEAAIDVFGEELAAVRRLDPSGAIDAGTDLAAAVQRGGKPEAATVVYGRLRRAFLFNAGVEAIVENRLARLELLGDAAPSVGLSDLDGKAVESEHLTGKVVLIDFWATNCPPCLEELPELRRLHADHHKAGFEILAVSLDEEEETVREYLTEAHVAWRVLLSSGDDDATREAFRVETIPANFLIGPDGKVARVDLHGADLRAEVERMVKQAK